MTNANGDEGFGPDGHESLSEAVVTAVAAVSGAEPVAHGRADDAGALEPLHDVLDPEALDGLFETGGAETSGRVSFSYHGYAVTVHGDGRIIVE